jgi:hypothetical protein
LGYEVVGSYLTQVHLQHELESNNYGVFLSDNDLYIKVKRMVYLSGRSDFKTRRNNCAAQVSDIIGALARLQIARAYAEVGDTAKAESAYRDFLTLWKDADPDIPIFKQAKTEYASLN